MLMKSIRALLKFSICLVMFITIAHSQEDVVLHVGDIAPTFFLRTLEGENFFLSKEIKADSPIILSFYATWCVPCRLEIPALEKMMTDPAFKNIRLYYVNVGGLMASDTKGEMVKQREELKKVQRHKERFKMTHPILVDRYAMTAQKYGAESLPTLIVIDGEGNLKYVHHGYVPGDEELLANLLGTL